MTRWSERLCVAAEHEQAVFAGPDGGVAALFSARAPGKDTDNEDGALLLPAGRGGVILAVADGVGGHSAGAHAARLALQALMRSVNAAAEDPGAVREAILHGFDAANRAVLEHGAGAATTLAVAEIQEGRLRTYHVGDSGVLAFGGRGKIKLQTIMHSPVGYALEAGALDEEAAMTHEERHIVSNVIGDPQMHVSLTTVLKLGPRDTVLLASDGLFDNMYTAEIVEGLRRGPLGKSLEALATACRARMSEPLDEEPSKPDDLTLIAFRPRGAKANARPG